MTVFFVTSIRAGATITTRHYLPTAVETEKLRRALAGDIGITVQEGVATLDPSRCTKRTAKARKGGRHVQ